MDSLMIINLLETRIKKLRGDIDRRCLEIIELNNLISRLSAPPAYPGHTGQIIRAAIKRLDYTGE